MKNREKLHGRGQPYFIETDMNSVIFNYQAANAARQYNIVSSNNRKTTEKLSSGYKINRAADDAAGLSISEKMRWNIRGLDKASNNCQDGASLLQVADGALEEVNNMLHRLTELSIQAANDTNTPADRQAIQHEIAQIRTEINRIGDTTEFNTKPLFKGSTDFDGPMAGVSLGDIPLSKISLSNTDLGYNPISSNGTAQNLNLQAIVTDNGKVQTSFNLVYGSGGTSHSSIKLSDGANSAIFDLNKIRSSNYSKNSTATTDTWQRDFVLNDNGIDATLTQKISIDKSASGSDTEKYYSISYELKNNSASGSLSADFLFNVDTAYNNKDHLEGYYINGNKVTNNKIFDTDTSKYDFSGDTVLSGSLPSSFSIVNTQDALSFSEKINLDSENLQTVSIGRYSIVQDWDYYNGTKPATLGNSTQGEDIAFTLIYHKDGIGSGSTEKIGSLSYGIYSTEKDPNLKDIPIVKSPVSTAHVPETKLWIQSGATDMSGFFITVGEMNSDVLGIDGMDVTTYDGAQDAIDRAFKATEIINKQRSNIGAQQNRLEYATSIDDNSSENTQAAESRIRDTDMASEMVKYSMENILKQAGEAMLAQANQNASQILSLIS